MKRVGYWMSEKKIKRLNFKDFHQICRAEGIDLIKLDLSVPLSDQGPFDAVVHKLTDVIARANQGDQQAAAYVKNFVDYVKCHPGTAMLDPLDNICLLLDRQQQYEYVRQNHHKKHKETFYFVPLFVEMKTSDEATNKSLLKHHGIEYPIVCKPTVAHGSSWCHQMSIVFHDGGLKDIRPPCVAQKFIPHDAVLYKVFIIGDHVSVVERPSLKNFKSGEMETIHFDSHDVSKADSASFLNELDDQVQTPRSVDLQRLERIAVDIKKRLGLKMFGVDVIIDNRDGEYAIIDINAFPGYDGVPDFFQALLQVIKQSVDDNHKTSPKTFQTSAGCDSATCTAKVGTNGSHSQHQVESLDRKENRVISIGIQQTKGLHQVNGICHDIQSCKQPEIVLPIAAPANGTN